MVSAQVGAELGVFQCAAADARYRAHAEYGKPEPGGGQCGNRCVRDSSRWTTRQPATSAEGVWAMGDVAGPPRCLRIGEDAPERSSIAP